MSSEGIQIVVTLLGGLAVFIFGMNLMSDGLQKSAGSKMRNILSFLTRNPVLGVIAGALVTAVLQSSSATTVMVIGFVSAGLMKLPQAISVIFGANIGTTITAQLIAFNIGDYAWLFAFIGFVMYFFMKKKEMITNIGQVIFGFGLLFVGINTMGDTMKPLASYPFFTDLMAQVQDFPVLGVLVGMIMTVVVQSSSATIAVLQNLASTAGPDGVTSILGLQGSLPILFGDNIGTTITALLASIGGGINAKRTALAHTIFNIFGTLLFIWFIPYIAILIQAISPSGAEVDVISRQIANAHLFFNVTNTLICLPFIWLFVKIVCKILPGKESVQDEGQSLYLDNNVLNQAAFATHLAINELGRIANMAKDMIILSRKTFVNNDMLAKKTLLGKEENLNKLRKDIVVYLAGILASETITEKQGERASELIHTAADIEHIGDNCKSIVALAEEMRNNKYEFSEEAYKEISDCFDLIDRMMNATVQALEENNYHICQKVLNYEKELNEKEKTLRREHLNRVSNQECNPSYTVVFMDTIHNIERIGDSCSNIAEGIMSN